MDNHFKTIFEYQSELSAHPAGYNETILILLLFFIPSDVVFSARLSGDVSFPLNGQVIFDNVISNVGNGYSDVTGNFTVRHNGTYELTLTTMGTHATAANIMRGEDGMCQAYSKEGSILGKNTSLFIV